LSGAAGTFNMHVHACASLGVNAEGGGLDQTMDADVRKGVRQVEAHQAEIMLNQFFQAMAMAITAHGLGLLALFGTTVQEMSTINFGDNPSFLKSMATIITWSIAGFGYAVITAYSIINLPADEADNQSEDDFGLTNASCYGTNPWFTKFEEKLLASGATILMVLLLINVSVVSVQSFVHWKGQKKSEMNEEIA